jgi:hypothetical protein
MPPRGRTTAEERTERNGAHASVEVDVRDDTRDEGKKTAARQGSRAGNTRAELRIPLPGLGRPEPGRLLWYGGLGALAAVGILEWPVAVVIGAATAIAARSAGPHPEASKQRRTRGAR